MAVVGDVDVSGGDEAAGGGAGGLHERSPSGAVWLIAVRGGVLGGGDGSSGFGGADGLVTAALVEEVEDGFLELLILC